MPYEYDVALSFAGENRAFADAVASGLRGAGVTVFYDDFYAEDLWGADLAVKLREIYHDQSRYCIMILSRHYLEKMWPSHERQQAIERMISEKGKGYILPVRLDGFNDEVPGLSGSIGFLSVRSSNPQSVIDAFLRKIGKTSSEKPKVPKEPQPRYHLPKIKRTFSDQEKNQFLRTAFDQIVKSLDGFARDTKGQNPGFDYEKEMITSRKALFTLYQGGKQVTQFKLWIGGMMGDNSIAFSYGNRIDLSGDSSMNDWASVEEHEGELKLKPMGFGMYGPEKDRPLSPGEAAEYFWKRVCESFR